MWKSILRAILPKRILQCAQNWRLQRSISKFNLRRVRHTYGDGEFAIELSDPLAEGWYDHDWALPLEIAILRRGGLRPGGIVFDLGAHQGVVALMLAREVGPSGKVVAVEALPHNATAALKNRDLNAMPWIEVLNAGAASIVGTLKFSRALNAQTSAASRYAGTVEVPTVTIDDLASRFGQPGVLFIDVEGMELDVLRGASKTMQSRPDAFVEVHVGHGLEATGGSVAAVLDFFPDEFYERFIHTEASGEPRLLAEAPAEWLRDRFFLTALRRDK